MERSSQAYKYHEMSETTTGVGKFPKHARKNCYSSFSCISIEIVLSLLVLCEIFMYFNSALSKEFYFIERARDELIGFSRFL